jgi:hypothetical protein
MMTAMKRLASYALGIVALAGWLQTPATAQIAYVPNIGAVPTGATMTVTPAVSADRRYVRLSVDVFFNDFNGFTTVSFPGGAVGGNFGGGFAAGLNGVIGDEDYQSGVQVGNGMNAGAPAGRPDALRAGPMPGDQGLGGGGMGQGQGGEFGFMPGFEDEAALMMAMENGSGRRIRSAGRSLARSPRRSAGKSTKSSRRQTSSSQRKSH